MVRADRVPAGCAFANDGGHVTGRVAAIEYQGALVRVAVDHGAAEDAVALVPDDDVPRRRRVTIGDPATHRLVRRPRLSRSMNKLATNKQERHP